VFDYLAACFRPGNVSWELMSAPCARWPRNRYRAMQDVLNLGLGAMNLPARQEGNWRWRMRPGQTSARLADRLKAVTELPGVKASRDSSHGPGATPRCVGMLFLTRGTNMATHA